MGAGTKDGVGVIGRGDGAAVIGLGFGGGGVGDAGVVKSSGLSGFNACACFSLSFAPLMLSGSASGWTNAGEKGVAFTVTGSGLGIAIGFGTGTGAAAGLGAGLAAIGVGTRTGVGAIGVGAVGAIGSGGSKATLSVGTTVVRRSVGLGPSFGSSSILGTGNSSLGRICLSSTGGAFCFAGAGVVVPSGKVTTSTTFNTGGGTGGGTIVRTVAAKIK